MHAASPSAKRLISDNAVRVQEAALLFIFSSILNRSRWTIDVKIEKKVGDYGEFRSDIGAL
jgi:hypothetical protein